jgi:hypothetical protein
VASQYIAQTPSAYAFPLLIKGLLESGVTRAPEQEIVSANQTNTISVSRSPLSRCGCYAGCRDTRLLPPDGRT